MRIVEGIDTYAQANAVGVAETGWSKFGKSMSANIARWDLFRQYTVVTPHPSR